MRSNALLVIARVADEYPDKVYDQVEIGEVVSMLDPEEEIERTREDTCWTLLYFGERATQAVPELESASEEDPSERVSDIAEMAADHIQNRDKDWRV